MFLKTNKKNPNVFLFILVYALINVSSNIITFDKGVEFSNKCVKGGIGSVPAEGNGFSMI